jgi:CRISPR-associated protein Cas6
MNAAVDPAQWGVTRSETTVDLRFELRGTCLPADYTLALADAVLARLPWLADEPGSGIHPVRGALTGDGALGLSRRTRLVLRVPRERMEDARALQRCTLVLGGETLEVGVAKPWPVTATPTLYALRVIAGPEDEAPFAAALDEMLQAMAIDCEMVLGRRSRISTPEGECSGYSVLLHGLGPAQSLLLQERGLGVHRLYGCGIIVPHKSVGAVSD